MTLRDQITQAADVLRKHTPMQPEVGLILGTGLGVLTSHMAVDCLVEYRHIPHFPISTVDTHAGELLFGRLAEKPVLVMSGRFHYYEGYTMQQVTFPVRVAKALGVKVLIVSNAAGGLNKAFHAGDMMLIADHINLMGDNPLIGPNDDELGPRFPDMSEPYDRRLLSLAEKVGEEEGVRLQRGVYVAVAGPNLETAAEYRFLRNLGADAVGMSTVPEVIVAIHSGLKALGISIITDECDPDALVPADVDKIIAIANEAAPALARLVEGCIARMEFRY